MHLRALGLAGGTRAQLRTKELPAEGKAGRTRLLGNHKHGDEGKARGVATRLEGPCQHAQLEELEREQFPGGELL